MNANDFVRDHLVVQIMAHAETHLYVFGIWSKCEASVDLGDGDWLHATGRTRRKALDALAVKVAAWLDEGET